MPTIRGTSNDDIIYGSSRADSIQGYEGDDIIFAGAGADSARGGSGDDTIYGEDGDDVIVGGFGWDELYGGSGSDAFTYHHQDQSDQGLGIDTIHDFETGVDTINLSTIDADATTRGAKRNEAFTYVESTDGVTPGHLTLSYDPATGITTLNGYTDTIEGADFTIYIVGQVDPATDILF